MAFCQTHFQNAQNFQVHSSQFNNIGPHGSLTIVNNPSDDDPVRDILWTNVAAGAIFDSAERYAAGKCHPGTRMKIIERITRWVTDDSPIHRVLWLHGPAGAGKSAIEHTMCELLKEQHPDIYGASFFFRSGHTDCGNARKLFTTLAYQLAVHFPSIRSQINDALSRDPSLPTKSMDIQFLSLIAQPLLHCQSLFSHSPILVIDGLDECANDEDKDTQRDIIALIGKLIVEYNLPLRVMVASRPEFWIRDAFDTAPIAGITQVLSLRDDVEADKDIKTYLIDGFEKIRVENKAVMRSVILPWPPTHIIDHLVYEASGQYIYASTVLKFVGKSSRFINPQKQLEIIILPGPYRALAFSELDRLYATILSAYPQLETMKRVLMGLSYFGGHTSLIQVLLRVNADDLALVLDALSSLIDIQEPKQLPKEYLWLESIFGPAKFVQSDTISFCHLSIREFLRDKSRSGAFYIDLNPLRHEIVRQFFDMFCHNLDQNYEIEPHLFVNLDHYTYHFEMVDRIRSCISSCSDDTQVTLLSCVTEKLSSFNPGSRTPDSLLNFLGDLEHVEYVLQKLPDSTKGNTVYKKFESTFHLAQQRAIHTLFLCSGFKLTPTLVYLTEFEWTKGKNFSVRDISTIPGTTDVISTIRDHRHFLHLLHYNPDDYSLNSPRLQPMNLNFLHHCCPEKHPRILAELNAARMLLASHVLPLVLLHHCCPEKHPRILAELNAARILLASHVLPLVLHWNADYYINFLEHRFFNSRETSDICTEEYFQSTTIVSLLALMTDLAIWNEFRQRHRAWNYSSLMTSILCWFYRQLTNQQTLKLLQDYDKSLPQRMTTTMTVIFELNFLPHLTKSYEAGLCAFAPDPLHNSYPRSILLNVLPLPQGFTQEDEQRCYLAYDDWDRVGWPFLLNEVFGNAGSMEPAINPLNWRPLLASRLLFNFVRFLYGQIHPEFSTRGDRYEESFPYITQCLPHADPTPKNLDAIRAIVYLYPQLPHTWIPPENFWRLIADFLQIYDRSILLSDELGLFMTWLESPDHADITTYAGQQTPRKRKILFV